MSMERPDPHNAASNIAFGLMRLLCFPVDAPQRHAGSDELTYGIEEALRYLKQQGPEITQQDRLDSDALEATCHKPEEAP